MPGTGSLKDLRSRVKEIMEAAWTAPGFCVPNLEVYPHQWLWDSCFHSLIWARLGDDRAVIELEQALANQAPNGFVPHVTYWSEPNAAEDFWGRQLTSSITQPPIYGHAAAELIRQGFEVPSILLDKIESAFRHLLRDRVRTPAGLVPIYHPWESGCDDSARWDEQSGAFDPKAWKKVKGDLISSLEFDAAMSPKANPMFEVGSVGFNALIVFNYLEFCAIPGVARRPSIKSLSQDVERLREAIAQRWDDRRLTWVDDNPLGSPGVRTADALLGLLAFEPEPLEANHVDPDQVESARCDHAVFAELSSADAFAASFGVAGVHRKEPSYEPETYWRGPSWPQLNYLLTLAVERAGNMRLASKLWEAQKRGVVASGFAEFWHPDSGAGLGAIPQSWAGLAILEPGA